MAAVVKKFMQTKNILPNARRGTKRHPFQGAAARRRRAMTGRQVKQGAVGPLGVEHTGSTVGEDVGEALVAADAGGAVGALAQLVHEIRLGDQGAAQGDHVDALAQHLVDVPIAADAAHQQQRQAAALAQPGRPLQIIGRCVFGEGPEVAAADLRRGHAQPAALLQHLGQVFLKGPVRRGVGQVAVDLDEDGEIGAARLPDGGDDLGRQAEAVFGAAAVGIGAVVFQRGEELGEQIAVGAVDLHAVHPGLLGPQSRRREGAAQGIQVLRRHPVGPQWRGGHGLCPGVVELHHHFGALLVHRLGDPAQNGQIGVGIQAVLRGGGFARLHHIGVGAEKQAHIAAGQRIVKRRFGRGDLPPAAAHIVVGGGAGYAVFKGKGTYLDRGKYSLHDRHPILCFFWRKSVIE